MVLIASPSGLLDADSDDFTRLHVEANRLSLNELTPLVEADPTVKLADDGEHLWVEVDRLRRAAATAANEGWQANFNRMLAYAMSNGWMSDDGIYIRAHLENLG